MTCPDRIFYKGFTLSFINTLIYFNKIQLKVKIYKNKNAKYINIWRFLMLAFEIVIFQ
tara:strand:+ start:1658 stop:1831 length:174 start_codon:yes stop_codon:yes gene_type:complete